MSISAQIGYCNHCNQNVLLKREDIDICLILILLFFTAGIGLIIYLIIYYSKPKNRCVHCNSITIPPQNGQVEPNHPKIKEASQLQNPYSISLTSKKDSVIKYCAYCGESIKNEKSQYCAHCGTKIND